jgi:nicotinamidase-related amidase
VKSSIDDLLSEIVTKDAALAKKVYVLGDCTSAVTVPNPAGGFFADYTPEAEAAMQRFASAGMHIVQSTDPMESWPGIQLP